jgi:hypothetical protein
MPLLLPLVLYLRKKGVSTLRVLSASRKAKRLSGSGMMLLGGVAGRWSKALGSQRLTASS